jgi:hypothetical protein
LLRASLGLLVLTLRKKAPQAVNVDGRAVGQVSLQVEGSHADLQNRMKDTISLMIVVVPFLVGERPRKRSTKVTYLTEVTRMVLIHQDSVVMLATGITTTTRVSSVLTDTTVTGSDVTSLLSVAVKPGGLK